MSEPLVDLDLGAAALYLSVVELGSISKAAARHGLSQPAASQRIRKLELQLGLTLLDRSASGSALTPDGRRVAEWCRELVRLADGVVDRTHALGVDQRLAASVVTTAAAADHVLPAVCADLADRSAALALTISAADTLHACATVREGGADLGLVDGPQPPLALRSRVVATLPMVVLAAPQHPWVGRRDPVTAEELARTPLVLRERPSGTRDVIEEALAARGHGRTAIAAAEASSNASVRALCALGVGPAVLCRADVTAELDSGRLVAIDDDVGFVQSVRLIWTGEEPHSAGARRFAAAC